MRIANEVLDVLFVSPQRAGGPGIYERTVFDPLPADWPGDLSIQTLVNLAGPLFIFAFTTCRFIAEADPQTRLADVLHYGRPSLSLGLEGTYLPILNGIIRDKIGEEKARALTSFRELVGTIVLLAEPLSA